MMTSNPGGPVVLGELRESVIREIANIGLGHATTSLAEMTAKAFEMSVPFVESVVLESLPNRLGGGEQLTVGIYMPIDGEIGGHIAFLCQWTSAQELWRLLLGQTPGHVGEVGMLESSALIEVGNIINSSFLRAISDMTGLELLATPPTMSVDMAGSILSSIVIEASMDDCTALSIRTEIHDECHHIEGFFVFIPTTHGLERVFHMLGVSEAA